MIKSSGIIKLYGVTYEETAGLIYDHAHVLNSKYTKTPAADISYDS